MFWGLGWVFFPLDRRFQFVHGEFAPHERNPRVDVLIDIERMPIGQQPVSGRRESRSSA
jgi:hypothetical protein